MDSGEFFDACANCGTVLDSDEWYPVVSVSEAGSGVDYYSFCGDDCRTEWVSD